MDVITSTEALSRACGQLAQSDFVALDTEFMRDQTYWPKLCLIQAANEAAAFVIDPLAKGISLEPFYALLKDKRLIKVFHAARQDIEIFHHQGGVIPKPLFDTQIAAMVCGFGEAVSYENLVRRLAKASVDKSSRFTDWSRRPLSEKQLTYAIGDVTHLCTVYRALSSQLAENGRSTWFAEDLAVLEAPATYALEPEQAWRRLKLKTHNRRAVAVLMEAAAWREREAQGRDVPRARVIKDDALLEIAMQQPQTPADLEALRAVPRGFSNSRSAGPLLAAVKAGLARDPKSIEMPERSGPSSATNGPLIDLLKVLLKTCAEDHGVAPRLIATVDELEQIASEDAPDVPALSGWREAVFGAAALALKEGRLALGVRDGRIVAIPSETRDS
ncbi:MAG: ribonuclease D [Alphaproteobacteria bacterium]|nr:ribonuclease D [Alphaproteobacteria bacterium]